MKIALRVDASDKIGTGHFMRCLTLADMLSRRGAVCVFLCRTLPSHLQQLLLRHGHGLCLLPKRDGVSYISDLKHANWLDTDQDCDAADTLEVLKGQRVAWLIVDHYALDGRWETKLRSVAQRILVIDDLADRNHDCDLLLDQNLYKNMQGRYTGKVPKSCRLLLGPKFALLREEFSLQRRALVRKVDRVRRIFIFFGGVDAHNYTGQVLEALVATGLTDFEVDVVLGQQHPQRAVIQILCQRQGYQCHVQTSNMAELMAAADLAIGAGGTAIWERCCLGLPTLAFCTADNQSSQVIDAATCGLLYAPESGSDVGAAFALHFPALLGNPTLRKLVSQTGLDTVDARGAERVAIQMGCSQINLRAACIEDANDLYLWRNHPSIRAVSRNTDEMAWDDHCRWLVDVLADTNRKLLIGVLDRAPVGVVRFDLYGDSAEVSIYLVPDSRMPCRGGDLLQAAESWLTHHCRQIQLLCANVVSGNTASKKMFMAAGYDVDNTLFSKKLHAL